MFRLNFSVVMETKNQLAFVVYVTLISLMHITMDACFFPFRFNCVRLEKLIGGL